MHVLDIDEKVLVWRWWHGLTQRKTASNTFQHGQIWKLNMCLQDILCRAWAFYMVLALVFIFLISSEIWHAHKKYFCRALIHIINNHKAKYTCKWKWWKQNCTLLYDLPWDMLIGFWNSDFHHTTLWRGWGTTWILRVLFSSMILHPCSFQ